MLESSRSKFTREISFQSKDKDISLAKVNFSIHLVLNELLKFTFFLEDSLPFEYFRF